MKQRRWWVPDREGARPGDTGALLSHRWVQAFVYKLPPLKPKELDASLRYKVQATLPVKIDEHSFRTQLFRHRNQTCGAAFLASEPGRDQLPARNRELRVGVPLVLPSRLAPKTLLFLSTPDGLVPYYYEDGLLKTAFAPIEPEDLKMRARIIARCPEAEIVSLAPDTEYPLPPDLAGQEPPESVRTQLMDAFPFWEARPPRRSPVVAGLLLAAVGLACLIVSLWTAWSIRAGRNAAWKAWLARTEAVAAAPSSRDQAAVLLKARGAPVPDLFARIAHAWGASTRIVDLEWSQGKLSITAASPSGLVSVRQLTQDPWFRNIRVDEIRTQKDGSEVFTIEGVLQLDQ